MAGMHVLHARAPRGSPEHRETGAARGSMIRRGPRPMRARTTPVGSVMWAVIVALGAALAAALPKRVDPEGDRRSALAHALAPRGITAAPEDIEWLDRPRSPLGGSARAIVRGSPTRGEPSDIFVVETRLTPEVVAHGRLGLQPHRDQQRRRGQAGDPGPAHRLRGPAHARRGGAHGARHRSRRPPGQGHLRLDPDGARAGRAQQRAADRAGARRREAHLRHRSGREEGRARGGAGQRGQGRGRARRPGVARAELAHHPIGRTDGGPRARSAGRRPGLDPHRVGGAGEARQPDHLGCRPGAPRGRRRRHADGQGGGLHRARLRPAQQGERVTGDTGAEGIAKDLGATDNSLEPPVRSMPVDPEIGWPPAPLEPWVVPALGGEGQWNSLDKDPYVRKNEGCLSPRPSSPRISAPTRPARSHPRVHRALGPAPGRAAHDGGHRRAQRRHRRAGPGLIPAPRR